MTLYTKVFIKVTHINVPLVCFGESETVEAVRTLHGSGTLVYAIGISDVEDRLLTKLASPSLPHTNWLSLSNYHQMKSSAESLWQAACRFALMTTIEYPVLQGDIKLRIVTFQVSELFAQIYVYMKILYSEIDSLNCDFQSNLCNYELSSTLIHCDEAHINWCPDGVPTDWSNNSYSNNTLGNSPFLRISSGNR